jgi:multidrug efflux pump subunit AcrA (membrane-fusion protein)
VRKQGLLFTSRHVALAAVLAAAIAGCSEAANQPAPPPPPAVTVATPTVRTITDWDEFVGRFEAIQQVQIRARVGGFVDSVEFKDGAIVKTGDLLYVIDPRPYEAELLQARGQLADAQARLDLAERELARSTELNRTQAVSDAIVDQRRQQSAAAQAAVQQAEGDGPHFDHVVVADDEDDFARLIVGDGGVGQQQRLIGRAADHPDPRELARQDR